MYHTATLKMYYTDEYRVYYSNEPNFSMTNSFKVFKDWNKLIEFFKTLETGTYFKEQ